MLTDDFLEVIKGRRSIRRFTPDKISDSEIFRLIDAAGYAPSNNNRQPWKFIVLRNEEKKKAVADAVLQKIKTVQEKVQGEELAGIIESYKDYLLFIKDAPVLIFALYKNPPAIITELFKSLELNNIENPANNELISTSMAVQNILLLAHSCGFGTCCTTGPLIAASEIKTILDIRPPYEPAVIIALGRYAGIPEIPSRKSVKDIIEVIE